MTLSTWCILNCLHNSTVRPRPNLQKFNLSWPTVPQGGVTSCTWLLWGKSNIPTAKWLHRFKPVPPQLPWTNSNGQLPPRLLLQPICQCQEKLSKREISRLGIDQVEIFQVKSSEWRGIVQGMGNCGWVVQSQTGKPSTEGKYWLQLVQEDNKCCVTFVKLCKKFREKTLPYWLVL